MFFMLQLNRQSFLAMRRNMKLAPKFYGPFQVLEKIGNVAYKLAFALDSTIHQVFSCFTAQKESE